MNFLRRIWASMGFRALGAILAALFVLLWITIGFWKTVLIALAAFVGYVIGDYFEDGHILRSWYLKLESFRRRLR